MTLEIWDSEQEAELHRLERKRLSENHYNRGHSLSAWLLATLVAVNGGAALSVMSRTDPMMSTEGARLPALVFAGGVVCAILSGLLSSREAHRRSNQYYFESLRDAQLSPEGKAKHQQSKLWGMRLGRAARLTNYLSLSLFVAGVVWTAEIENRRPVAAPALKAAPAKAQLSANASDRMPCLLRHEVETSRIKSPT
jgi:hypothetical protein